MSTETEGYAAYYSNGYIRLYATEADASADEDRRWVKRNIFIQGGCPVNARQHYRGRLLKRGIAFGRTDQSFGQMLAQIHNAWYQDAWYQDL